MMEWMSRNTVMLTEAIRQVILVGIVFGLIQWNEQQIAAALMAVSAILALFVRQTTVSTVRVEEIKAEQKQDLMTQPPQAQS